MKCDYSENGNLCGHPNTEKVWCPTWISSIDGPHHFCAEHSRNFKPEFNKNAKDGKFYWGAEADTEFEKAMKEGGTLRAGFGGWDVTTYAFGGDFFRAKTDIKIVNLTPHPSRVGWLNGEMTVI